MVVTGQGFTPSGTATVNYAGVVVATSQAGAGGTLDTSFTVPISATLGSMISIF